METPVVSAAPAMVSLLRGLVDYAGLFPPAQLGMAEAVAAYASHRRTADAWILGRFVVPAARLSELAQAAAPHLAATAGEPWPISVLVGSDPSADSRLAGAFVDANRGRLVVHAIEAKAGTPAEAERFLAALAQEAPALRSGRTHSLRSGQAPVFLEIPLSGDGGPTDLGPLLEVLKAQGASAKVRTGGLNPEAVPTAASLARFLCACAEAGVAFKATAGLHHPVRSVQAFTSSPDSPRGTMHGFLNVFVAAALVGEGLPAADAERLLLEERPGAFVFLGDSVAWEGHRVAAATLARVRRGFALGFGSCSFDEPVHDLRALGLL